MMNNALSDIFHNQTALTRERLSFCEANIKDLNEWVTTLSIMQLGDTSKALFTAILELNELNCSETLRFDLIQTLHPTINNVLASLEKTSLTKVSLVPTVTNTLLNWYASALLFCQYLFKYCANKPRTATKTEVFFVLF